jgi:hypothetical protein
MPARLVSVLWVGCAVIGGALCGLDAPGAALAQADNDFPYSIMAPEPGAGGHHHAAAAAAPSGTPRHASLLGHEKFVGKLHRSPNVFAARTSSGSVLPTALPRTRLIPPEGSGTLTLPAAPQQQGPTFAPSAPALGAVPNLPHGAESFQDRASRCSFQAGLYGVPNGALNRYIGACVQ